MPLSLSFSISFRRVVTRREATPKRRRGVGAVRSSRRWQDLYKAHAAELFGRHKCVRIESRAPSLPDDVLYRVTLVFSRNLTQQEHRAASLFFVRMSSRSRGPLSCKWSRLDCRKGRIIGELCAELWLCNFFFPRKVKR